MTCSSCKYLKEDNKIEGKVSGCCYFCTDIKSYVRGDQNKCSKHEKAYGRTNYNCDKIYNEGIEFYDDDRPTIYYIWQLILVIIFCLALKLFT